MGEVERAVSAPLARGTKRKLRTSSPKLARSLGTAKSLAKPPVPVAAGLASPADLGRTSVVEMREPPAPAPQWKCG